MEAMAVNRTRSDETEKVPFAPLFERFADNLLSLRTLYPEAAPTVLRCGAYYGAVWRRSLPERSLLSCRERLEGVWSPDAGELLPFAAAALCTAPDAENGMRRVMRDRRMLERYFPASAALDCAGLLTVRLTGDGTDADELIAKAGKIGARGFGSPCRRLLLAEDAASAERLGERLSESERLLGALYGSGRSTEALAYAVSCFSEPEAVCMKLCLLQKLLKRRGLNPPNAVCLAGLAGGTLGCEAAAEQIAAANAFLKKQPGFGIFAISPAERVMWSCLLLSVYEDAGEDKRLSQSGRAALCACYSLLGAASNA